MTGRLVRGLGIVGMALGACVVAVRVVGVVLPVGLVVWSPLLDFLFGAGVVLLGLGLWGWEAVLGVLACDELHVAMATLVVVSFIVFVMGSLTSGDGNDGVALWMGRWGWRASVFLVLLFVLVRLRAWAVGGKGRWWALVRALGLDEAWVWGVGGVVLAGFGVEYDRLAPWHFQAVVLCLAGLGWIGLGFAELVRSCWGEEVAGMFWDAEGWCWRWFSEPFSLFRKIPVVPVADETPVADEAPVVELPGGVLARWLDMQCGPGGGPEPRGTVVEAERIRQAVSES